MAEQSRQRIAARKPNANSLSASLAAWNQRRYFEAIRLDFYQDYIDSGLMFREFAQARAEQLLRRRHPATAAVQGVFLTLRAGRTVAEALKEVAPSSEIALIAAYEKDNRLNEGFAQIVRMVSEEKQLRSDVMGLLRKPAIYIALAVTMLTLMVPSLVDTLGPLLDRARLTTDQRVLLALSDFMAAYAFLLVPGLIGLLVATIVTLPLWRPGAVRKALDRHSPLHRMYRDYQAATFLKVLAVQLTVTPQLDRALADIARNSTPWMRGYIEEILRRLPRFRTRELEAFDVGLLGPDMINSLQLITKRATAEQAFTRRAEQASKAALKSINGTASVLQQVGIAVAGLLIAWVAFSLVATMIKQNIDKMSEAQSANRR